MLLTSIPVTNNLSGSDASVCKGQELPAEAWGFCFGPLRPSIRTAGETDSVLLLFRQVREERNRLNLSTRTLFLNQRNAAISTAYQLWVS
jgi:hypothetical protein